MEIFLIRLLQFMLAISLLVLLHEGGHFFFSKLFGVRVEKFYLFFDPSILKWDGSLLKKKIGETQYGIGWLPLGGYCKIAGMIDESFDTEQMKQPVQSWEFRSKPAWQRLLIMIGGVLVNFLLALFIYSMVLYTWGDEYIQTKDMSYGMKFNNDAKELGFQDGDILLSTDAGNLKDFSADLFRQLSTAKTVNLIRQGQEISLSLPGDINYLQMLKKEPQFVRPLIPNIVDTVAPHSIAHAMGMKKGDEIVAINGNRVESYNDFTNEMGKLRDVLSAATTHEDTLAVEHVTLSYRRTGTPQIYNASAVLSETLLFGFSPKPLYSYYEPTKLNYNFFESFPAGVKYGCNVLSGYVRDLKYVFTSDGAKSLGGFGAIGSLFPPSWDWHLFWLMTAFLSIILAFMNILPIPALDGGHVLFLLYEMITGKQPSERFLVVAEYIGFGALLLLLIIANGNDILRWLGYM